MRIHKGDNVIVIAGKDKGRQVKVSRVFPARPDRGGLASTMLIVGGVNMQKRRERPRQQGKKGQTVQIAAPLDASNVMLYCGSCGQGVRTGVKLSGQKKLRVCKKCGRAI